MTIEDRINTYLTKAVENNCMYIDDHDRKEKDMIGMVEFNNPHKGIGLIPAFSGYYSINSLYTGKDKKMHLSTASIGGVLCGIPTKEKIQAYNESCLFDGGKIKAVNLFTDGNLIMTLRP